MRKAALLAVVDDPSAEHALLADLFGEAATQAPKKRIGRCLPSSGFMRAAKVPLPEIPPPRFGLRRVRKVDSFAGGGGASNGCEAAFRILEAMGLLPAGHGETIDFAINHDDAALAMHTANHPGTLHLPHNVWQVSLREILGDDLFGLLWLSPDCRDHSSAKGGPITSRGVRDLAWVLFRWLKELPDWQRPWTIFLENVGAFSKWSPLVPAPGGGFERDKSREGETFYRFVKALARLGYSVGWKELVACEYGSPTIRKRLYLCAKRDGSRIDWPKPTHGAPKSEAVRKGRLKPWPVAADIIDFERPCPSIFMTKEEARAYTRETGVRLIRPLADKTYARLAKGVRSYVLDAAEPFLVTINHSGAEFRGLHLGDAMPTVTRARDAHGLVVPHIAAFRGDQIGRAAGDPAATVTANSFIKRPGGASPLGLVETAIVPHVSAYYGDGEGGKNRGAPTDEPLRTVPTEGRHAVVEAALAPFVAGLAHGDSGGRREYSSHEPLTTVHAGGNNQALAVPYLVPRYGERDGQEPRTRPIDIPAATAVPDGNGGGLAMATIAPFVSRGQHGGGNRPAEAPHHTVAASDGDQNQVVAVYLAQHNTGLIGHDAEEPVSTVVQKGCTQSVVAATMVEMYGRSDGRPPDDPLSASTQQGHHGLAAVSMLSLKGSDRRDGSVEDAHPAVCAGGQHSAVVTLPLMTAYYSTGGQHAAVDDPSLTVPTKARFGLTEVDAAPPPLSDAQIRRARQVAEFLREHGCWDGGEIVTLSIRGTVYILVDIGMRMLIPRELARAQDFPDSYILAAPYKGGTLSETEQRHKIGNSVCEKPACAVIVANYRPPLAWGRVAYREAAE